MFAEGRGEAWWGEGPGVQGVESLTSLEVGSLFLREYCLRREVQAEEELAAGAEGTACARRGDQGKGGPLAGLEPWGHTW